MLGRDDDASIEHRDHVTEQSFHELVQIEDIPCPLAGTQLGLAKPHVLVEDRTDQEQVVGQPDRVAPDVAGRDAACRERRAVAVIDERESVRNPEVEVSFGGLWLLTRRNHIALERAPQVDRSPRRHLQQPAGAFALPIFQQPDRAVRTLLDLADAPLHIESLRFARRVTAELDSHQ